MSIKYDNGIDLPANIKEADHVQWSVHYPIYSDRMAAITQAADIWAYLMEWYAL